MNIDAIIKDQLGRNNFSSRGGRNEIDIKQVMRSRYTSAPTKPQCRQNLLNAEYLVRQVMLYNINPKAELTFLGDRPEDDIIRPIAMFDIMHRDLQTMKDCDLDDKMKVLLNDTLKLCKGFHRRVYYGMSEAQIAFVNEFYEPLEEKIQKDYDILRWSILNATTSLFDVKKNQEDFVKAVLVHVAIQLTIGDITRYIYANIKELEQIHTNIKVLVGYFCNKDPHDDSDVYDLNLDKHVNLASRIFQSTYYRTRLVNTTPATMG